MTPADRLGLAVEARERVVRVIALLQSPTVSTLGESTAELTAAIESMAQLQSEFAAKPAACASKTVITALRRDLQRAGLLLRHAWELRIGRAGPLGYSREGELIPQSPRQTRWAIEG